MSFLKDLLDNIKDFFMSVFFPSSPDYQKKRHLKIAEIEVKKVKPPIYRSDGTILPGFATIILQLYQQVLPIKKAISSSIASKDVRLSSSYIDKLIEHAFTEEQTQKKKDFSYENRSVALDNLSRDAFDEAIQTQKRDFNAFMHSLEVDAVFNSDRKIERLLKFHDFLSFNFNRLLARFDASFEQSIGKDVLTPNYSFSTVKGEALLQDILDFSFLVSNTQIDDNLIDAFMLLNSLLPEENKLGDVTIEACFKEIPFILQNVLKRATLINLIILIKQDPDFQDIEPQYKPQSHIAEYRERARDAFNASTKKLIKLKQDKDISTLITATFDKETIIHVSSYNDEVNARIQSLTHLSFDWVRPLEVIKTFTAIHFERVISLFLREVMVEGYFQDHDFQEELGIPYHYCENLGKKILEFEGRFEEKGTCSIISLNGYLEAISKGGDFRKQLSRIVDEANNSAKNLCLEAGKAYYSLFKACEIVIQDAKKAVPAHITNIRALSLSTKNKESYSKFEACIKKFETFIEILKNYIVLDNIKNQTSS